MTQQTFIEVLTEFLDARDNLAHWATYQSEWHDHADHLTKAGEKLNAMVQPGTALQSSAQNTEPKPVMQYYYKSNGCKAKNSDDESCTCWHDEGTGLHKAERFSLNHPFLKWREKPAQAEDAICVEEATPNVEWTQLDAGRLTNLDNSGLENRPSHGPKTHTVMLPRELPEIAYPEGLLFSVGDSVLLLPEHELRAIYKEIVRRFGT